MPGALIIYYSSIPVNTPKLAQFDEHDMFPTQAGFVPYPGILYTVLEQGKFHAFLRRNNSLF
jgi:hypothetical protein